MSTARTIPVVGVLVSVRSVGAAALTLDCCGGFLRLLGTNDSIYKNQFSIIIKPVMIISIFIIIARISIF